MSFSKEPKGPVLWLAWLGLGCLVALPYGSLVGGFTTPLQWAVAAALLTVAMFVFAKGADKVQFATSREDITTGRGMMIAMFSGLMLPVALNAGGVVPVPHWIAWYHGYRFTLGVVLAGALMTGTVILRAGSTIKSSNV